MIVLDSYFALQGDKYLKHVNAIDSDVMYPYVKLYPGKVAGLYHMFLNIDRTYGVLSAITNTNAYIFEISTPSDGPIDWKDNCDSDIFSQNNLIEINDDAYSNFINNGDGYENLHEDYWGDVSLDLFTVYNVRSDRVNKFVTAPVALRSWSEESNTVEDTRMSE